MIALALDEVDAGRVRGFEDLTLAGVAARAGVAVPSLYKHVAGLPALRREVAQVCVDQLTQVLEDAARGRSGAEALRAIAHAVRELARTRPGRYSAVQGSWARDPDARTVQESAVGAVQVIARAVGQLGVPPAQAVHAVRAARSAVHGFVMLEMSGGFGLPEDVDASFDYLVELLVTGLTAG